MAPGIRRADKLSEHDAGRTLVAELMGESAGARTAATPWYWTRARARRWRRRC